MIYKVRDIIRDARVAMDENKSSTALIAEEDVDTLTLDEIIGSKVAEAVRVVVAGAPLHLLDGGEPFGDDVYWRDQCSGWTPLPEDFMRLLIFKMSDWERPVYEPITAADARYQLQSSRYKGLRGNPQRPVVAICSRAEGRVLEFYSCADDTATVEQAQYVPLPSVDEYGGIEIPERCYRPVAYQVAALAYATLGNGDMSNAMTGLRDQFLS